MKKRLPVNTLGILRPVPGSISREIAPAVTWGRLCALDLGYLALEVPPGQTLAGGTDDPLADAATQASSPEVRFDRPEGDWDLIEGGLMTFADPGRDLPPIDGLEGFRPAGHCLYRRVLVAARWDHEIITAWSYAGVGLREGGGRVLRRPEKGGSG